MKLDFVHPNVMHAHGRRSNPDHAEVFKRIIMMGSVDETPDKEAVVLRIAHGERPKLVSLQQAINNAFGPKRHDKNKFYVRTRLVTDNGQFILYIEKLSGEPQ